MVSPVSDLGPQLNVPGQVLLKNQLAIPDSAFYEMYGQRMVEAAEAGIESQRNWTLYHMGCVETHDPYLGKDWEKRADSVPVPEAVFGLRARMFARLQEGVSHMAELKPKDECPVPEDEMVLIAHALGHEFTVSNIRENGRGVYVDACLSPAHPVARTGIDFEEYHRHKKAHPEWIEEDYRAHLGYTAIKLAAARDLKLAPPDPAQERKTPTEKL
jgi:hypothetical protein